MKTLERRPSSKKAKIKKRQATTSQSPFPSYRVKDEGATPITRVIRASSTIIFHYPFTCHGPLKPVHRNETAGTNAVTRLGSAHGAHPRNVERAYGRGRCQLRSAACRQSIHVKLIESRRGGTTDRVLYIRGEL